MKEQQDAIFDACSEQFHDLFKVFNQKTKEYLNGEIFDQSIQGVCLDIGNGGEAPVEVFSEENLKRIRCFIGLDYSYHMLAVRRFDHRLQGSAFLLPFKSASVDTVIARHVIHHLGLSAGDRRHDKLLLMLREINRVIKPTGRIIILETMVPRFMEVIQLWIVRAWYHGILRKAYVPICMFSRKTLEQVIPGDFYRVHKVDFQSLRRFTLSYFDPLVSFLKYPWFKLPVFLQPYRYVAWVLEKKG